LGSRYRQGVLWVFVLEVIKDGLESLVIGYCVVVIEMVVGGSFFMNVEALYGIEVDAFSLEL
jgi:hypothetical protein